MAAPWPLCLIAVPTSLLDPLGLHPGGPVSDPFLVHFGDGFGTHFGAHLERLNYPVEEQEGIRKLRRSVSQPGKLPLHASQVLHLTGELSELKILHSTGDSSGHSPLCELSGDSPS